MLPRDLTAWKLQPGLMLCRAQENSKCKPGSIAGYIRKCFNINEAGILT